MYTSTCIEESRIGRTISHTDIKDVSHSHSWIEEDRDFDYQLDQWVVYNLFQNLYELIIRYFKLYIEYWGKFYIKNKSQLLCTLFLKNYVSLAMYDEDLEKIFIIEHKQLQFDKNCGWNLIGITEKPDRYLLDHDYFCIHGDIFDRIQSTHQDIISF